MTVLRVEDSGGQRLDVYVASKTGHTRSYIKQLIDGGHIMLNGCSVKSGKTVSHGDEVTIDEPVRELKIIPQDIPFEIIYEDDAIAVIDKPAGLSVHPAGGAVQNTLVNALMYRLKSLSTINGTVRPGIVHRLDKDTTGVMVVAKTDAAHLSLSRQIAARTVKKIYRVILEGVVKEDGGQIATLIARDNADRKKMTVTRGAGREAVSVFRVLERFESNAGGNTGGNTYAEFDIKTGRTHQIRVHAKHIGHPVAGDRTYGYKKQKFNVTGQLLHAYMLGFRHPVSGEEMIFTAPLPAEFQRILALLRNR